MRGLRMTPKGEEYFELNWQFPGAVPATKNHEGGLSDSEDESDAKIFLHQIIQTSRGNNQELLVTLKSKTRCSFSAATGGEKF